MLTAPSSSVHLKPSSLTRCCHKDASQLNTQVHKSTRCTSGTTTKLS